MAIRSKTGTSAFWVESILKWSLGVTTVLSCAIPSSFPPSLTIAASSSASDTTSYVSSVGPTARHYTSTPSYRSWSSAALSSTPISIPPSGSGIEATSFFTSATATSDRSPSTPSSTTAMTLAAHFVEVGENNSSGSEDAKLSVFSPNRIDAPAGDLIELRIHGPYEVYRSHFEQPCDSSLPPLNELPAINVSSSYKFVIPDLKPLWFYAVLKGTPPQCDDAVFAVNPGDKMTDFLANAHNM